MSTTDNAKPDSGPPDGRAAGYSAGRTLPFTTELRRQFGRRRTQLAIGFLALLMAIPLSMLDG